MNTKSLSITLSSNPGLIPGMGRSTEEVIGYHCSILGLPWWLSWSRIQLQCRRPGFDPWVRKILRRRERLPTPVLWPGEFHRLYSPWGCKESDTTEQLSPHLLSNCSFDYNLRLLLGLAAEQATWFRDYDIRTLPPWSQLK